MSQTDEPHQPHEDADEDADEAAEDADEDADEDAVKIYGC